jgi:hypothetical protein
MNLFFAQAGSMIFQISASQEARITGVSHCAYEVVFVCLFLGLWYWGTH